MALPSSPLPTVSCWFPAARSGGILIASAAVVVIVSLAPSGFEAGGPSCIESVFTAAEIGGEDASEDSAFRSNKTVETPHGVSSVVEGWCKEAKMAPGGVRCDDKASSPDSSLLIP